MFPKQKKRNGKRYSKPSSSKATMSEAELQDKVEDILLDLDLQYVHIPGNLQRYLRTRAPAHIAAEASRAFKGMPDLLIFSKHEEYNVCLLLELKTEIGKLSQSQRDWSKGLNLHVAYGIEEAKNILSEFANYLDK
jgi:hypothetical protein